MRLCAALRSSLSMESLSFLAKSCAGFGVHGSQVKVLTQPSEFYEELCQRAASSQKRIVLVIFLPCNITSLPKRILDLNIEAHLTNRLPCDTTWWTQNFNLLKSSLIFTRFSHYNCECLDCTNLKNSFFNFWRWSLLLL